MMDAQQPPMGKILATVIGILVAFVTSVFVEYAGGALIDAMFGGGQKSLYGTTIVLTGALFSTFVGGWIAVRGARSYGPAMIVTGVCALLYLTYVWVQSAVVRDGQFIQVSPFNWVMGALAVCIPLLGLCLIRAVMGPRR